MNTEQIEVASNSKKKKQKKATPKNVIKLMYKYYSKKYVAINIEKYMKNAL